MILHPGESMEYVHSSITSLLSVAAVGVAVATVIQIANHSLVFSSHVLLSNKHS